MDLFLGIDVGTGSARAGLFDSSGVMHGVGVKQIAINRPQTDYVEQSSDDIWRSCCAAVGQAMKQAGAKPEQVKGIGFDATCSLVAITEDDRPVTISPSGDDQWNIIVWMDHRAVEQAGRINAKGHNVLKYVGGTISPEMETPKLLWLKENMPKTWRRVAHFFDLPDWLVHRATGNFTRSLCTTVCKWTHLGHEEAVTEGSVGKWDESYFRAMGLGDLADEGFNRLGTTVRPMGERAGGLTAQAAEEMGLATDTPVGVAIIDAHAGGLGVLGAGMDSESAFDERVALIGGTSSCHMACSADPRFIDGIWGPYFSAMVPGLWLNEGGQSATGALVDHVIYSHARALELKAEAIPAGKTVYDLLNERLDELSRGGTRRSMLTLDLHVLPYFHGNRSPRADPSLRGVVSGLNLEESVDALALLYLATIQAIAHGTRHIIAEMNAKGYRIDTIMACGGGTKNPVFLQEHANATGCRIVLPREPEAVLTGAALLGGVASGVFESVVEGMRSMGHEGGVIEPEGGGVAAFHEEKHRVFLKMHAHQMELRSLMA